MCGCGCVSRLVGGCKSAYMFANVPICERERERGTGKKSGNDGWVAIACLRQQSPAINNDLTDDILRLAVFPLKRDDRSEERSQITRPCVCVCV